MTVNIIGLDIGSKAFLGSQVEIDHSVGKGFGVRAKIGYDIGKSPIVCPVNLFESQFSRVVDHDQGNDA